MTQPANEKAIEAACRVRCQSGIFETGQGTCALTCMDQLGDARKRPCSHIVEVHGKHIRAEIEAYLTAAPRALPADDVGEKPMPLHRRLEWKAVADHFKALNEQLESENARLTAALAEERVRGERLAKALKAYGSHVASCQINNEWHHHKGCDCGLARALEQP